MNLIKKYTSVSLILRIIIGLLLGVILGLTFDNLAFLSLLGTIFVGALKAVAPVLVFVLVIAALQAWLAVHFFSSQWLVLYLV